MAPVEAQSWHHGLVARWWSLFRTSGPEIDYFRQFVEPGQPSLDLACGTGRLLVPYVAAALDVDGVDASPDMVALCRDAADAVGATPNLSCQAMHELTLARRYRTIYICGGLGLGSTREQDQEALRRVHRHLEPGGRLVLDNEVPYSGASTWAFWPARGAHCHSRSSHPATDCSAPTATSTPCRRDSSRSTRSANRRRTRSTPFDGEAASSWRRSVIASPSTSTSAASSS